MIRLPNGDVAFPKKGEPPADFSPKYERDKHDLFLFHLKWKPCQFREYREVTTKCGRKTGDYYCKHLGRYIAPNICEGCDVPERQTQATEVQGIERKRTYPLVTI